MSFILMATSRMVTNRVAAEKMAGSRMLLFWMVTDLMAAASHNV